MSIKDDNHLKAAHKMIDRLLQEDLDSSGEDYLNVLADLVEAYEDRHFQIPDASDVDVLRELMRSNGLGQTDLARKMNIAQSTFSTVLNGSRKLTKNQGREASSGRDRHEGGNGRRGEDVSELSRIEPKDAVS